MINNYSTYKIFEKIVNGKMILYRGDSSNIEKYDETIFNRKNIFGLGLYLTNNPMIAYSYTAHRSEKLDEYKIDIKSSSKKLVDAEFAFIIHHLLNEVNGLNIDVHELDDMYYLFTSYEKEYSSMYNVYKKYLETNDILYLRYNEDTINGMSEDEKDEIRKDSDYIKKGFDKNQLKLKEYHLKYDTYIKKAEDFFIKNRKNYVFVNRHAYDDYEWIVIIKNKNEGVVSKYEVDLSVVNKMYDANSIIDDNIIEILKKTYKFNLSSKEFLEGINGLPVNIRKVFTEQNKFKYANDNFKQHEKEHTLSEFLDHNKIAISDKKLGFSYNTWKYFQNLMKKSGYSGIKYIGEKHLYTSIKHINYVVFDLNDAKRIL